MAEKFGGKCLTSNMFKAVSFRPVVIEKAVDHQWYGTNGMARTTLAHSMQSRQTSDRGQSILSRHGLLG